MEEERLLMEKYGKDNPFRVPDNYFDGLSDRIMGSLSTETPRINAVMMPRKVFLPYARRVAAAACACAVVFAGSALFIPDGGDASRENIASSSAAQYSSADYAVDQIADYAMLSNEDMYSYLSEE